MSLRIQTTTLRFPTTGRGTTEITAEIQGAVSESGMTTAMCTVFVHHTSASLILCENADPVVRDDLERFMANLVPDGYPLFQHIDEGPDDMPAHVRSILTQNSLNIPVGEGQCNLGTWQGVYLWEHRSAPHTRRVTVTLLGE